MSEISIILPVYNAEKYLEKCLDSLLEQTFRDIEIIAVNDGSTDKSLEILQRYAAKDSRIKIIDQKQNQGLGPVRNLALSKAGGQYVMFCDSDDTYTPTMCERMKDTLEKTGSDMVICDCQVKEEIRHWRSKHYKEYVRLHFKGERLLSPGDSSIPNAVLWNKIFKNSLIQKYHITFPPTREHDDLSFVRQYLFVSNKIYGLNEQLYNYLLRKNSIMGTFYTNPSKANRWDRLYSWKHTVDFLVKNNKWPQYKEAFIKLLFSELCWLQEVFRWEHFSKDDLQKISSYLVGIPLSKGQNDLEDKLYALQQGLEGFPDKLFASHTEYVGGIFPLKTRMSWNGKRVHFCGLEVYKEEFTSHKKRWLGIVTYYPKAKSCSSK